MARQIDERVVEMRFDNSDFMKKVKPTINSLDQLKQSLKLEGAAKGFDAMQQAANKVDMKGLGGAVDSVKEHFSALEAVAVGALMKIGSQIASTAERMLNEFTLAPITQGFGEYEEKLNSIQTIMNATGLSLDVVNGYLDDLNTYADKTIYSFSDMTGAIKKFTSSGVDMVPAIEAIKGVSNATAYAGLGADAAASAFYNFSQALATGYLGYQDYRSVGMTFPIVNQRFREELVKTALDLGTLVDEGDHYVTTTTNAQGKTADLNKDLSAFQYSLQAQWVTSDVLIETLRKYSDETTELGKSATDAATHVKTFTQLIGTVKEAIGSGWAKTWELLIGDLEEAQKLWTGVNDVISGFVDRQSDARNNTIQLWKAFGGRKMVLDGFSNVLKSILKIITPIKEAFTDVFPKTSIFTIVNATKAFRNFTESLIISDETANIIKEVFTVLFKVIKGGLTTVKQVTNALISFAKGGVSVLKPFVKQIKDFGIAMKNTEIVQNILKRISDSFLKLKTAGAESVKYITEKLKEFKNFLETVVSQDFADALNGIVESFNSLGSISLPVDIGGIQVMGKQASYLDRILDIFKGNESLYNYITNMIEYIRRFKEAFTFDKMMENVKNFETKFSEFSDFLKDQVEPIKGLFEDLFSNVTLGGVLATGGGVGLIYAITKVAKAFGEGAEKLKALPEVFESLSGSLKAYQDKLKAERLKEVAKAILILSGALVILSFADMDKVFLAATALSAVAGALSLGVDRLFGIVKKIKTWNDATVMFGKAANNFAKAIKWKAIGSALKSFGESILMIAGSIIALALMYERNPEAMANASKLVAEIGAAITAIVVVLELVGQKLGTGSKTIANVGIGVFALSSALYVAVKAIRNIFDLSIPSDYKLKLGILAGVFLGLIVVAKAVNKTGNSIGKPRSGPILALAILLYMSISVLNRLFKMELPLDYKSKLAIMAGLFLALGYVAKTIGKASSIAQGSLKAGGTILAMAVFMVAAVGALKVLTDLDGDKLYQSAIVFGGVLLALSQAIKNASKGDSVKGQYKVILSMALLVGVVVAALGVLSMIPMDNLFKSVIALGAVILALSNTFKNMGSIRDPKGTVGVMITMIVSLLAIAGSLFLLAYQPWDRLLAASVGISLVLRSISDLTKMLSSRTGLKPEKIKAFQQIVLMIIPITGSLFLLAFQPWDRLLAASAAIGIVMSSFALSLKLISSSSSEGFKPDMVYNLLACLIPLAGATVALRVLAKQPWDGLLAASAAIGIVMAEMAAVLFICSKMGPSASAAYPAILALAACMIPMGIVAFALYQLSSKSPETLIAAAEALGIAMSAMVVALGTCVLAGVAAVPALVGIGVLIAVVKALRAFIEKIGETLGDPEALTSLENGAIVMQKIGQAIGNLIGGVVAGTISTISTVLPQLGTDLSTFAENLGPFITTMRSIDQDVMDGIKAIARAILALTAAELLNGISSFFSFFTGEKTLKSLGDQLVDFAEPFKEFSTAVVGVNASQVENCADAMTVLFTALSKIPNSGGMLGKIVGENDISEEYASNIVSMGKAIAGFSNVVSGKVDVDSVTGAADAMKALFSAFSEIPNSGGLLGRIFGENDPSEEYASNMISMGKAIADFSGSVSGKVDSDGVIESAEALKALFLAFSEMPNSGGVLGDLVGNNDISEDYANNIVVMGRALHYFSNHATSVDTGAVRASAMALQALFTALHDMPNEGGVISWFTGDNTLAQFSPNLIAFGEALASYSATLESVSFDNMNSATDQLTKLVDLTKSVTALDNMYGLVDFVEAFSTIGTDCIDNFIAAFTDSHDNVLAAIQALLTSVQEAMTTWNESFTQYGTISATAWITGFTLSYELVVQTAYGFVNQFFIIFTAMLPVFMSKGTQSANKYLEGVKYKYPEAYTTGLQLANRALNGINLVIPSFRTAGEQAGQGFVDGLLAALPAVEAAAAQFAQAAASATSIALDINSPSKVFRRIGGYTGEGFVLGITDWISRVAIAATKLGDAATEEISSSLSPIQTVFTDDISTDIVMTPRFDLSNVESSAEEVNRMFNKTIGAIAIRAGTIDGSVSATRQVKDATEIQNQTGSEAKFGNTYNFIQNNTSPKALSRIDIYRQTRNQFSNFRREVGK